MTSVEGDVPVVWSCGAIRPGRSPLWKRLTLRRSSAKFGNTTSRSIALTLPGCGKSNPDQASPKGEYYVTDLIKMAVEQGKKLDSVVLDDPVEGLGVNNRIDLADCEVAMRKRVIRKWMLDGVSFLDPDSCTVESDVVIGKDTVILPNTHLRGKTVIGENNRIGPDTTIQDTTIGNDCRITYSFAEQAWLGNRQYGPFSHLRPGAVLKDGVHIGNFGEVKDSTWRKTSKWGIFLISAMPRLAKTLTRRGDDHPQFRWCSQA